MGTSVILRGRPPALEIFCVEMAACQGLNSVHSVSPRVSDFTDRISLTLRLFFFTWETSDIPQSEIKPRTHHINKNGIKNMFTTVSVS